MSFAVFDFFVIIVNYVNNVNHVYSVNYVNSVNHVYSVNYVNSVKYVNSGVLLLSLMVLSTRPKPAYGRQGLD